MEYRITLRNDEYDDSVDYAFDAESEQEAYWVAFVALWDEDPSSEVVRHYKATYDRDLAPDFGPFPTTREQFATLMETLRVEGGPQRIVSFLNTATGEEIYRDDE